MNDVSTEAEKNQEYLLDFICYLYCNILLLVNIQHVYYILLIWFSFDSKYKFLYDIL
jgi:hypothetical protein